MHTRAPGQPLYQLEPQHLQLITIKINMAPNSDDPQRDRNGPEDNPFIAFRRFADSQVSSLLNTVFTLPATLANWNNAHHAREQCLFGQADPEDCNRLRQIEQNMAKIRVEGRELYRIGDVQAVLQKGDELMKLDREADSLRRTIVEEARATHTVHDPDSDSRKKTVELVERIANEKGQHWGWSWDWGFPRPFNEADNETKGDASGPCRVSRYNLGSQRVKRAKNDAEDDWQRLNAQREEGELSAESGHSRVARVHPHCRSPAYTEDDISTILEHHLRAPFGADLARLFDPRPFKDYESYSPRTLEKDEDLRGAGIQWRDAFEDLIRAQLDEPLIPQEELGHNSRMPYDQWAKRVPHNQRAGRASPLFSEEATRRVAPTGGEYPKRVPWEGEETSEEPSYEYAHDHEDQHDDPPTPKMNQGTFAEGMPATELEAYERLLGPTSQQTMPADSQRPSILATLTTTERTVAPDGTVTTKVVLKKRFADGREESSETVHTQRGGQDTDYQDPRTAMQEAAKNARAQQGENKDSKRNNGWFWSSK